jgi:CBS domain-containing protein
MDTSMTVGKVLRTKNHGFITIGPAASAFDALELMAERNLGALLVVEDGKLVGVFSERDYARKVILKGKSSKNTQVQEIMSKSPITVSPETSLRDCMVLMAGKHFRHLPVIDHGTLVGVLSMRDVVNTIISNQESTIEELEEYIAGTGYRA